MRLLEVRGNGHVGHLPGGGLIAELADAAARELEGEEIGLLALGERRRGEDRPAEALDRIGDVQFSTVREGPAAGQQVPLDLDAGGEHVPVVTGDVRTVRFGPGVQPFGRIDEEPHHPHDNRSVPLWLRVRQGCGKVGPGRSTRPSRSAELMRWRTPGVLRGDPSATACELRPRENSASVSLSRLMFKKPALYSALNERFGGDPRTCAALAHLPGAVSRIGPLFGTDPVVQPDV